MLQLPNTTIKQSTYSASKTLSSLLTQAGWIFSLCLFLCYPQHTHAESNGRIVKWKDDKGVTHYGDRIPAQYSNRESSVINRQGVTIKHNKPISQQEEMEDISRLEQDRKDKALLGAFTNANEIDLARDRNIQLDSIALENLQQEKHNSQKQLSVNKDLAANLTKNKKPIPADLNADITKNMADIERLDQRIDERKQAIENTRKRFDDDKKRYLMLKRQSSAEIEKTQKVPTAADKPMSSTSR